MAVDYFLKMDTIKGESKASGHKDEIDVLSFHWGVVVQGGATGGGRAVIEPFHFTHRIDLASPLLIKAAATGQHIPTGRLTVRKISSGSSSADYLKYTFTDVLVSSAQHSGQGEALPLEEVSLNYSKLELAYYKISPDGGLGAPLVVVVGPSSPA
jgi:type VI secretion system secreted protein Hcp